MAAVIDAKFSTIIGTPDQLMAFFQLVHGSAVIDLKYSNVLVLDRPVTETDVQQALQTVPGGLVR